MANEVIWLKGHVYGGNYTSQQAFDLIPVPQKWVEVEPRPGIAGSRLFWNKGMLLQEVIQDGKLPVVLLDWDSDPVQVEGKWRDLGPSHETIPDTPNGIARQRKDEEFNRENAEFYTGLQKDAEKIGNIVASSFSYGKIAIVALAALFVVSAVRKR